MAIFPATVARGWPITRFLRVRSAPSWADLLTFLLLAAIAVLIVHGAGEIGQPLAALKTTPVTLDVGRLPEYALRTTLRMFAALGASLVFTFVFATLAAKNRKAEMIIVPALDILQSVPVLGFLTFTVTFFMNLFPGRQLGVELASIFAVFTAQAWNMAFSFYQSLRSVPGDLDEVSRQFGFSAWRRFVRLDLPFATPGLVWNMMMSMSGAWFFVVASEAITVGNTTVTLPGIGSWLALAIAGQDLQAVAIGVGAMAVVILLYDQLMFRPIVAWADKFRFEQTKSQDAPRSWVYDLIRRTRWLRAASKSLAWPFTMLARIDWTPPRPPVLRLGREANRFIDGLWLMLISAAVGWAVFILGRFVSESLSWSDVGTVTGFALVTLLRVVVMIIIASLIWVPIGVWIGLRPIWAERLQPIAQFLAAFPANVLFPFAVVMIIRFRLDPNIWLSPLIILGTQWYILFNVIAGASAISTDLKEAARIFNVRGWQWWRQLALPGIFPYYITGALTASGGSWNASIVAEAVSWGNEHLEATGLGSFIARATAAGDTASVALGVAVMSVFVTVLNRTVWRPLYRYSERRLRLD
jgi:NitT/TauT family transport system permease protein